VASLPRQAVDLAVWTAASTAAYFDVFLDMVRHGGRMLRQPGRRVLLKQIYFTGIEALPLVTITALVTGFSGTSQLYHVLLQDMALTIDVFRYLFVQEASILIVAFFVLARSGSAMAAELADLQQKGEVASLYRMGIDPASYLVAPRVAACLVSVPALAAFCQVIMVLGGLALMALFEHWDFSLALSQYTRGLHPGSGFVMAAKAVVFGATIGAVCCRQGLAAMPGPLGVPVAARTAMVHGFAAIVILEGLFVLVCG
jgi:phospholipid/cholesterol/gamma-HCH transport system permease protein